MAHAAGTKLKSFESAPWHPQAENIKYTPDSHAATQERSLADGLGKDIAHMLHVCERGARLARPGGLNHLEPTV